MSEAATWMPFGTLAEFGERAVLSRTVGGRAVAVARLADGSLCAFGALCPHQHADLSGGILEDDGITCPDHLWHFELPSGRCTSIPGARLPRYEVRRVGERIEVQVVPR